MKRLFMLSALLFLIVSFGFSQSACPFTTDVPNSCDHLGNVWHCKGAITMAIASSSAVRSGSFYVPKYSHIDEIDLKICDITNDNNVFIVYSTKFNDIGTQTQIAINARNKNLLPNDIVICSYEIWGKRKDNEKGKE